MSYAITTPLEPDGNFDLRNSFPLLQTPVFGRLRGKTAVPALAIFEKMSDVLASGNDSTFDNEVFWEDFYQTNIKDFASLIQLLFILAVNSVDEGNKTSVQAAINKEFSSDVRHFYGFAPSSLKTALLDMPRFHEISFIMNTWRTNHWDAVAADNLAWNVLASFFVWMNTKGKNGMTIIKLNKKTFSAFIWQHNAVACWMGKQFGNKNNNSDFEKWFNLKFAYYKNAEYLQTTPDIGITTPILSVFDFGRAYCLELIPEEEMTAELTTRLNASDSLSMASKVFLCSRRLDQPSELKQYSTVSSFRPMEKVVRKVVDLIIESEINRGQATTPFSRLAIRMTGLQGSTLWVKLLKALGYEDFSKIDNYHGVIYSKREVVSAMIRACTPSDEDDADNLAAAVQLYGLEPSDVATAAVIAPQWLELTEQFTSMNGLKSIALFFHAHIGTDNSDEIKKEIAQYTSIPLDDMRAGAFALDWFKSINVEANENVFRLVSIASKYISSGAEYSRMKNCIIAVKGRLSQRAVRNEIIEKRSKVMLISYGLIPLGKRRLVDLQRRYQTFMKFFEESRDYGYQRQLAEEKAVKIAIFNLAQNAGYPCVEQLIWDMEADSFKDGERFMVPKMIDGLKVYVAIDEVSGEPYIRCVKHGWGALADLPPRLKRHSYVKQLKEAVKRLNNPYLKDDAALRVAMDNRQPILYDNLIRWAQHPILCRRLQHVRFTSASGHEGYFTLKGLATNDQKVYLPTDDEYLTINSLE
jgi:hypothetical protein